MTAKLLIKAISIVNFKKHFLTTTYTVSHFSYAPPFQGPHFMTKILESNILYDVLLIDILSDWWNRKNIEITHANHSATSKAILTKMLVYPELLYFLFEVCARNYPW